MSWMSPKAFARTTGTAGTAAQPGWRRSMRMRTCFVATLILLAVAAPAARAETIGAGYSALPLSYPDGSVFQCPGWSGGADGEGNFYVPCGQWIYQLGQDGTYQRAITVPGGYNAGRDVAVTHTGSAIYFTSGPLGGIDQPNPATQPTVGKVVRMLRGADGNYYHDPSFDVGPFNLGNGHWAARNVDVDLHGRVYVSVNAYVFIFDANGTRIGAFGSDNSYNGAQYLEGLEIAMGLAVTPDGRTVYVVEQRWNHVQRWDQDDRGGWHRSREWRIGALGAASDCIDNGSFSSPYDVGLDGSGNLYVLDVSCRRIQKYQVVTRAHLGTIWRHYEDNAPLYHGLALNWRGAVVVAEQRRYLPTAAPTGCHPDGDAPAFTRLVVPAVVGADRRLGIDLRAADGCSYVSHMNVTGDASTGGWTNYKPAAFVVLSAGDGPKTVHVSVRDAYGRTATRTVGVRLDSTLPVIVPRRRVSVRGAKKLCRPRAQAAIRGSGFRVVDRCATLTGKVVKIRRRGRTQYVTLRINRSQARRLYVGVSGSVNVLVIGHVRTPAPRKLRRGKRATITAALAVDPDRRTIAAYPAFHWTRR